MHGLVQHPAVTRTFSLARRIVGQGGSRVSHRACRSTVFALPVRAMATAQQQHPPLTLLSSLGKKLPDATWQQSMLRIRNVDASLTFYRDVLGMTLVDQYDFPQWKFSLYFLQTLPVGVMYQHTPGSPEAHRYLWSTEGVTLELTHNHDSDEVYHAGNQPRDGFGHIAFSVPDLAAAVAHLDGAGVLFKKRPEDGKMRNIAFAYDPDKYWVELVERNECKAVPGVAVPQFALAQTMLRVKDPAVSVKFYTQHFEMTHVRTSHNDSFSTYFLASMPIGCTPPPPSDVNGTDAKKYLTDVLYPLGIPVLELTHNHGTEKDETFTHANGNEAGRRGFGHLGFLVSSVYATYEKLSAAGVPFHKTPDGGSMKGLAFAKDPDGYLIEIIKRGQDGQF